MSDVIQNQAVANVHTAAEYLSEDELTNLIAFLNERLIRRRVEARDRALREKVIELTALAVKLARQGVPGFPFSKPQFGGPPAKAKDLEAAKAKSLLDEFIELQDTPL